MHTKLDTVCDMIGSLVMSTSDVQLAIDVVDAMDEYSAKYERSFRSLMRIPGFRKLWRAVYDGAVTAVTGEDHDISEALEEMSKEEQHRYREFLSKART